MVEFAGVLLALAAGWSLLRPHFDHVTSSGFDGTETTVALSALYDQRERCIQVLRDVELDHSTRKISEQDYSHTQAVLLKELSDLLKRIDQLEKR